MHNEKGLTLVEVIAAIILLSIILISIFSFLLNSTRLNNMNDESIQAMNIARSTSVEVRESSCKVVKANTSLNGEYYTKEFLSGNSEYTIKLSLNKNPESGNLQPELHLVHIQVMKEGAEVSDTYTYCKGELENN
ncbi:prepilin-type N-terminal cleavage/methylation domain-containing protein [Ureibacillus manganicus]|uniref:Prepilin-type N-terminal cleavage/methylation domain-containing protein n=1 Tax=Ureibacillus manganicus DSM 26584 TaxID=1384049 RepID=A0A0A3I4J1_9BACL|nr:prepilin-type N-terminal cleavage/methylation domain-containing protein [Ureibacillus manganicus]KGR79649.1 hypothetical protein CD29_06005 [Ureibacillus manganicus DSM 26584]